MGGKGLRAKVFDDYQWGDPLKNLVRLVVVDEQYDRTTYLAEDGTWRTAVEGAANEDMGIRLQPEAVEAIAVAIQAWQGHASHADTEARVLREWLAVERGRVDQALAK